MLGAACWNLGSDGARWRWGIQREFRLPQGDQIPVTLPLDSLGLGSVSNSQGTEVSQPDTARPGWDEPAFFDNGRSKSVRGRHGAVQGTETTACIGIVHSATCGYAPARSWVSAKRPVGLPTAGGA